MTYLELKEIGSGKDFLSKYSDIMRLWAVVSINSTIYSGNFGYGMTPVKGSGSGLLISQDGYILTNNHVIEGSETVDVLLNDGRKYQGQIAGTG